jgi:hypothetical protein
LVDLLYDACAVQPGRVRLVVSASVPPHELFLPLLGAAARAGVNPNLGRAAASRLDVKQLIQVGEVYDVMRERRGPLLRATL